MSELGQLPSELAELFAAERAAPAASSVARAAVRAKLAATIGAAPLGGVAAAAGLGTTGKVLATVAIVAGIGGGAAALIRKGSAPPVRASAPVVAVAEVRAPVHPVVVQRSAAVVMPSPPVEQPPPPSVSRRSAPERATMPRSEPELLRGAWHALSTGDAAGALHLLELDARVHRAGALTEERTALRVLALAKLHDASAPGAAATFIQTYPDSVYRELVSRAVATNQEGP